jgi:hypothetical protein
MGIPRTMPDLHGGDGVDVLEGRARVRDEHGADLTDAMIAGAEAMLSFARAERAELAVLTDMSAACGTQVISDGCRLVPLRRFQKGVGVAAATLLARGHPRGEPARSPHRRRACGRGSIPPGSRRPTRSTTTSTRGRLEHLPHQHPRA